MKRTAVGALLTLSQLFLLPTQAQAAPTLKTNFDGCTPAKTMYFAYSADHTKAVEFCEINGNYRYSYGPIDKADTQFTHRPGEAGVIHTESGPRFAIHHEGVTYWTSMGRDGSDILVVSKGDWSEGHRLSIIYLEDGMGYVNKAAMGYKDYNH